MIERLRVQILCLCTGLAKLYVCVMVWRDFVPVRRLVCLMVWRECVSVIIVMMCEVRQRAAVIALVHNLP